MTLACGTGACAAALDAYRRGYCENEVEILLPKGRLAIQIDRDGGVWMSGPAERIIKERMKYEIARFYRSVDNAVSCGWNSKL